MSDSEQKTPKAGDVVKLKSGGPKMTCGTDKDLGGLIQCHWFFEGDPVGGPYDGLFYPDMLVMVNNEPVPGADAEQTS